MNCIQKIWKWWKGTLSLNKKFKKKRNKTDGVCSFLPFVSLHPTYHSSRLFIKQHFSKWGPGTSRGLWNITKGVCDPPPVFVTAEEITIHHYKNASTLDLKHERWLTCIYSIAFKALKLVKITSTHLCYLHTIGLILYYWSTENYEIKAVHRLHQKHFHQSVSLLLCLWNLHNHHKANAWAQLGATYRKPPLFVYGSFCIFF